MALSPAARLLCQLDTNEFSLTTAKTLPRRSLHTLRQASCSELLESNAEISMLPQQQHVQVTTSSSIPMQHAPRPMTLPMRGTTNRVRKAAELVNLDAKQSQQQQQQLLPDNCNELTSGNVESCESPNYITNTSYTYPEKVIASPTAVAAAAADIAEANPIPLPPREGKKQVKSNEKRHVRKYPLIIPANGVQRTLSKVTNLAQPTAVTNGITSELRTIEVVAAIRPNAASNSNSAGCYENLPPTTPTPAKLCINNPNNHSRIGVEADAPEPQHTYQNLDNITPTEAENLMNDAAAASADTASMQFESILEDDSNKDNVLQSPDVTDGFYNFSIQKEHYNKSNQVEFNTCQMSGGLYVNEDELRNLDMESKVTLSIEEKSEPASQSESSSSSSKSGNIPECNASQATDNELAGNALFRKVRESVNLAMSKDPTTKSSTIPMVAAGKNRKTEDMTEAEYFAAATTRLADSNSVSCEDLLEFANKKPKGCERGVDSDEVRIMMKVLRKDSTEQRCLDALTFINWDVHKAIKLVKLQNILHDAQLNWERAYEALQNCDWDLHTTAIKFNHMRKS